MHGLSNPSTLHEPHRKGSSDLHDIPSKGVCREVMGAFVLRPAASLTAWVMTALVVATNIYLVALTLAGSVPPDGGESVR